MEPSRCTSEPFSCTRGLPPYLRRGQEGWLNFHWRVFRARTDRAGLVISDWPEGKRPGRHPNQKLMCNFIEVQPYLEE